MESSSSMMEDLEPLLCDDFILEFDYLNGESERFGEVIDIEAFKDSHIPKNTRMKVMWAVKIYEEWLTTWRVRYVDGINKVLKTFDEMTLNEMDYTFQYFFGEVRKQDGALYPPRTLRVSSIISIIRSKSLPVYSKIESFSTHVRR